MKTIKFCILIGIVLICISWKKDKPTVFLIGDSISIQYWPFLQRYMEGIVTLDRKEDGGQAEKNLDIPVGANGGDSGMVLNYLRMKTKDDLFHPAYLLINCGLHDIKHSVNNNKIQIPPEEYAANLKAIIQLLKEKKIRLIWISTTPVVDSIHNSRSKLIRRYGADVVSYNHIANEICLKNGVPVIDLYEFTKNAVLDQYADHVHYKQAASALQAAYIAGFLQEIVMKGNR